jgi:DNA invertase Pin-like site-specific DNA recombinase
MASRHRTTDFSAALAGRRAAVYLRMSTDHQRYSMANQIEALARFGCDHGLTVVSAYADEGKSGLSAKGRPDLQRLILDVQGTNRPFDVLLTLDVSRWGRFQNVDESAYYEYLCWKAGVQVIYCAEAFENDGSPMSTILKSMKRVMAAEYSRDLSRRVSVGHCHLARLGYHQGGTTTFGLRRLLVDEHGEARQVLEKGQRKSLTTERVVLIPGPPAERKIIRRAFRLFLKEGLSEARICARFNAEQVPRPDGARWTTHFVRSLLTNEAFLGTLIYNRRSLKLQNTAVWNPPEQWIRCENRFEAIVSKRAFAQAQRIFQARLVFPDDETLLDHLRALHRTHGTVTAAIINGSPGGPKRWVYQRRFGTLLRAYERANLPGSRDFGYLAMNPTMAALSTAMELGVIQALTVAGHAVTHSRLAHVVTLAARCSLVLKVVRCRLLDSGKPRWRVQFVAPSRAQFCLLGRMNPEGTAVMDYYLFPTARIGCDLIILGLRNDAATDAYRFEGLDELGRLVDACEAGSLRPLGRIGRHEPGGNS